MEKSKKKNNDKKSSRKEETIEFLKEQYKLLEQHNQESGNANMFVCCLSTRRCTTNTFSTSSSLELKIYSFMSGSASRRRRRREAATLTVNKEHYARIANPKSYELLGEDLKGTLPVNRTIVFNCNDPETTICVQAVIPLYDFKPNKPLTVTMKYHVDLKAVNQILIEPWEFFVVVVGLNVQKTGDPLGTTLAVAKNIEYNIISKHQLYGTPIWVIIVSVIGGLLVLALITYGMYRAGFFKRATKEEMDKLMHQATLSTDGVTEASNLNTAGN
ncbi:integrin alpha-PS3-like [Musca domestica]|uniref:Integrin alpha-PS3-like n=1 Tax=Musca domestica TaxID=7370 RepID=A0ABM3USZ8_MUSDO|nr:integrin alpha-PS3-like [Musca domestica]